jgi:uncharacterized protein YaaR (DUF327 family)
MDKVGLPDNILAGFVPGLAGRAPRGERKAQKERMSFRALLGAAETRETDEVAEAGGSPRGEATGPSGASADAAFERLLDDVHRLGEELSRKPGSDAILAYKDAVRAFVRRVVDTVYAVEERTSGGSILKRKKYTTIAVVDAKLERLAADILAGQREKLEILRKVDEIAGLLVDLLS